MQTFTPYTSASQLPQHVPIAVHLRGGLVESLHYGSLIALDSTGRTLLSVGDPLGLYYPRSSLKPLQAVAMVRAGLALPPELLALAAASHSGSPSHASGARQILALHGLDESALENVPDLPYGVKEREAWLRSGGSPNQLTQNCSGKHAAMAATCAINDWKVDGYSDPEHPLQQLIRDVVEELTNEQILHTSTDGCGTPVFALSLRAMATAFSRMTTGLPGSAEAAVVAAMLSHPEQVAGEGRDVTELMRRVPGLLAKDGFEGIQLVALADGRAVALKIADGGDRARMPVTVQALVQFGVDPATLSSLASIPVLGGGLAVGELAPIPFSPKP
jgi:L-asparaginase II